MLPAQPSFLTKQCSIVIDVFCSVWSQFWKVLAKLRVVIVDKLFQFQTVGGESFINFAVQFPVNFS